MSDDLLQLLFAAALILFGLLGGRKKKKRPTQQPPRRRPAPSWQRPATATTPRPPSPRPAPPRPAPAPTPHRDVLVQELERLLGGRVEVEAEPAEAVSLEPTDIEERRERVEGPGIRWAAGLDRKAESLETLEAAGETSHLRFHERYPTVTLEPTVADAADPAVARLRTAIIWSEILGPPVSLR